MERYLIYNWKKGYGDHIEHDYVDIAGHNEKHVIDLDNTMIISVLDDMMFV